MKTDKKTKYLIAALIGLLFVVTIVHSMAILEMSKRPQGDAQVLRALDSKSASRLPCLSVTPDMEEYRVVTTNQQPLPNNPTRSFIMGFKVKNNCTSDIKIANSDHVIGAKASVIERDNFGSPVVVDPLSNTIGLEVGFKGVFCPDCDGGMGTYYYAAENGGYNNMGTPSVRAYTIPAGETKFVSIQTDIKMPPLANEYVRVAPSTFSWFFTSALSDNYVSAGEMRTYAFAQADSYAWAMPYTRAYFY